MIVTYIYLYYTYIYILHYLYYIYTCNILYYPFRLVISPTPEAILALRPETLLGPSGRLGLRSQHRPEKVLRRRFEPQILGMLWLVMWYPLVN
jgi:hypothetical protein